MTGNINPTTSDERIEILDVLRGFAVGGILIGNIQWFSGYGRMPVDLLHQTGAIDQITHFLVNFFIEGKFYSIFSFLFGFGFALQIARAERRGDTKAVVFKRRLVWLFVIGLLHAYLIWAGDILSVYAVTGFFLFLFRRKPDASLLKWAFALLAFPILGYVSFYIFSTLFLAPAAATVDLARKTESWNRMVAAVSQGGYWEIITGYNLRYAIGRYENLIADMRFPKLLAMFLLGFYAYRRNFFGDLLTSQAFFRRVLLYGLILGIAGNAVLASLMWMGGAFNPPSVLGIAGTIAYAVGVPSLALAYIAAVALLWRKAAWRRRLAPLAPVGRMALTNYLLQSVICVILFYGYGFGLFGKFGAAVSTGFALLIFLFQMLISNLWLKYFLYGPMEWIWRQLTYNRRLNIRPQRAESDGAAVSYN